jgi:hypothetical protein
MSRTPMAERAFSTARKARRAVDSAATFHFRFAARAPSPSHSSCAGLTRASINQDFLIQERWIAGSSPAMTTLCGAGTRLKPTLVVKMSDTSLWQSGFESRL